MFECFIRKYKYCQSTVQMHQLGMGVRDYKPDENMDNPECENQNKVGAMQGVSRAHDHDQPLNTDETRQQQRKPGTGQKLSLNFSKYADAATGKT